MEDYKYLGVAIDNRLDWKSNTEAVYFTSWGSWDPLCAAKWWRSSTSLFLPSASSLLLYVGLTASKPAMSTELTRSSRTLNTWRGHSINWFGGHPCFSTAQKKWPLCDPKFKFKKMCPYWTKLVILCVPMLHTLFNFIWTRLNALLLIFCLYFSHNSYSVRQSPHCSWKGKNKAGKFRWTWQRLCHGL